MKFQQNLRLAQQQELPIIALISQHGLGAIANAGNQLEAAEQYHLDVVRNPHKTAGREAAMDMYRLIRIYARLGQPERSRELVEQLKADARMMGQSFLLEASTGSIAGTFTLFRLKFRASSVGRDVLTFVNEPEKRQFAAPRSRLYRTSVPAIESS